MACPGGVVAFFDCSRTGWVKEMWRKGDQGDVLAVEIAMYAG